MMNFAESGSLERDAQDALCLGQVFWTLHGHKPEKAMDGAQAHIQCFGLVVPLRFQMCQERSDPLDT